jgi:hypothetical protein
MCNLTDSEPIVGTATNFSPITEFSMNAETMIQAVNTARRMNKNKWYTFVFDDVQGKRVEIKGYNTWLQVYRVDGVRFGGNCDLSVREYVAELSKPFA